MNSIRLGNHSLKIGSGATPRGGQEVYGKSGIALIRSQNVYNNQFDYDGLVFIDEEEASKLNNVIVEAGDVLLNITGDSVARVCQAPSDILPARVNQHVVIIRPDPTVIDPTFLRYFLASSQMQSYMLMIAGSGATRKALTKGMIEDFQIPAFDVSEQREIARILSVLDNKIELNRRMNETLEATARAIFKSWFVDFDPVRAKAEGRQPVGMDAETAALFPDAFEESKLGLIPAGWRVGMLGEVTENPRRGVNPQDVPSGTLYIGLEHMPQKSITLSEWGTADDVESNKSLFYRGEFLFGKLRPYFHKVGIAPIDGICSTDILVLAPISALWAGFALFHISSDALVAHTTTLSSGTKMPRTSWRDIAGYSVVLPSENIAAVFSELVSPMLQKLIANVHELRVLAEMRDALLPKLISGEVRVGEIRDRG